MKVRQKAWAGAISAAVLWALPASAETLSDALANAYKNSGLITQNRAVLRAADEDVAQAVAALRPVVSYVVGAQYREPTLSDEFTLNATLAASMTLYDFGQSDLAVDAAKESVLATRAALIDVENAVLFNAVNAYLSVRRAEAFVELRENNVRLLTQQLRATRDQFDVGEITRTDVSLAEARLAAARSGLAAEQGNLALAQEVYKVAVGSYPGRLVAPPAAPSIPRSEGEGRDLARKTNPLIKQVQHQVAAADLGVEQAARAVLPSLDASGSFSIDNNGDDATSIGIELSGPI